MAEVHERIYGFRQNIARGEIADGDVIALTAASIFDEAWLLCFDEFHVTDIADAMILGRLFAKLFELGTVVVATSNVAPDDLYKDGLNRALFLPFIAQISDAYGRAAARCPHRFPAGKTRRRQDVAGAGRSTPPTPRSTRPGRKMTGNAPCKPRDISIKGRMLHVPCSAHGVARFSFADLCEKPLAASDYLRLAHDYHTILIDRIPVMDYAERNAAKRFIALIDTLYDNAREADGLGRGRSGVAVSCDRRHRGQRVQANLVAADRDELGILSGAAPWPQGFRGQRLEHGTGGDVSVRHSGAIARARTSVNSDSGLRAC